MRGCGLVVAWWVWVSWLQAATWSGEDAWGRKVTVDVPVQRVVALSSGTVELMFALSAGEALVGRSEWSVWPEPVQSVPSVGSMARPDLAALLRTQPDLVIVPKMAADRLLLDKLAGLGVPTVVLAEGSWGDLQRNIDFLGLCLGKETEAAALQQKLARALPEVAEAVDEGAPKVLLSYGTDVPYSANGTTWVGEVLTRAGVVNICEDLVSAWPRVSLPFILQENPDWILLAPSSEEEAERMRGFVEGMKEDAFWQRLAAVQQGQVRVLSPAIWHIPGPRMVEALQEVRGLMETE